MFYLGTQTGLEFGSTGMLSGDGERNGRVLVRCNVSLISLRAASTLGASLDASILRRRCGWGAGGGGVLSHTLPTIVNIYCIDTYQIDIF